MRLYEQGIETRRLDVFFDRLLSLSEPRQSITVIEKEKLFAGIHLGRSFEILDCSIVIIPKKSDLPKAIETIKVRNGFQPGFQFGLEILNGASLEIDVEVTIPRVEIPRIIV